MDTKGLVSLDYCVASVLNELGHDTKHRRRLLQFAIDAYTELNLFHFGKNVKVVYLVVDENGWIDFPEDYLDYNKIAVVKDGGLWTLTLNENMPLARDVECGEDTNPFPQTIENDNGTYFLGHYRDSLWVPRAYASGGGYNTAGTFRLDPEKGRIQFQHTTVMAGTTVVMEYISSGVTVTGVTVIPRAAVSPVKGYIHWKRVEYDVRVADAQKERKRQLYLQEVEKFRAREGALTRDELYDLFYGSTSQGAR
jgi:hypothetical protein